MNNDELFSIIKNQSKRINELEKKLNELRVPQILTQSVEILEDHIKITKCQIDSLNNRLEIYGVSMNEVEKIANNIVNDYSNKVKKEIAMDAYGLFISNMRRVFNESYDGQDF